MAQHRTTLTQQVKYWVLGTTTALSLITPFAAIAFPISQPNLTTTEQSQSSSSNIAETAKPAIVRIESTCSGKIYSSKTQKTYDAEYGGSASGFFANPNGYIVSNAHAVNFANTREACHRSLLQSVIREMLFTGEISLEDYLNPDTIDQLLPQTELRNPKTTKTVILPNGHRLPYEIVTIGAPVGQGKDVVILKIDVKNAPTLSLADSSKARLLQPVIAAGYPASGESSALNEASTLQASFTPGSISAFKTLTDGSPVLQFSAPTTHGGSGGPVLNAQGEVEGITTFGGDTEISGYAFAIPASTIAEFLDQANVENEDSPSNELYQDAIALYNQKQYGRALSKFLELQKLFPQHSEVPRFVLSCRQQIQAGQISTR